MRGITDKMIRQHPHVFGTTAVSGSDEVLVNWAEIKKQEKEGKEWMESYLPGAFDEAEELIGAARKRKGFSNYSAFCFSRATLCCSHAPASKHHRLCSFSCAYAENDRG